MIPKFHGDIYTPFKTNDEKYAGTVSYKERKQQQELEERMKPIDAPKTVMSMTVTDAILGNKEVKPNTIYPSMSVPIPNPNNPIASTYMVPWNHNSYNVPVIKKYNISIQGADGNLTSTGEIFEDILPPTHIAQNRMTTLSERQILYSYIRSILVKKGDGEEIGFTDKKPEIINLLSYMKMLEINPYHFSRLTNNPYRTMPDNFIMFRSCYPIRLHKNANFLACAKESIGANIRIYAMTIYDELANKINTGALVKRYCDVWREIMFYQYIREEILKKKICPHFPYLYSYYLTKNTGIDFNKIKNMKKNMVDKNVELQNDNNAIKKLIFTDTISSMLAYDKNKGLVIQANQPHLNKVKASKIDLIDRKHKVLYNDNKPTVVFDMSNNKFEVDITKPSGQCIVAITEAPNQNIINWSTRSYVIDDGPVRKQLNTGIHDLLTWRSVVFQILIAFYVMDLKGIMIKDMSWSRNIFIKDLDQGTSVGYWKYKIGGIDYYVPNLGSLVLIDSCYDELKDGINFDMLKSNDTIKFKLNGNFFNDQDSIKYGGLQLQVSNNNINEVSISNFKNLFSSNVFTGEFNISGGIKPPQEIMNLIDSIGLSNYRGHLENGESEEMMVDIILNNFSDLLHNKIGKQISENEKTQLYTTGDSITTCKKGNLIGIKFSDNSFYWGIYLYVDTNLDEVEVGEHWVLTKDTDSAKIIKSKKNEVDLAKVYGKVDQSYKAEHKLTSEEELLETYIISY